MLIWPFRRSWSLIFRAIQSCRRQHSSCIDVCVEFSYCATLMVLYLTCPAKKKILRELAYKQYSVCFTGTIVYYSTVYRHFSFAEDLIPVSITSFTKCYPRSYQVELFVPVLIHAVVTVLVANFLPVSINITISAQSYPVP